MKTATITALCGFLFGIGLGISGMTDANKVIGFLNLAGTWDPSLAFVMVGAIGANVLASRGMGKRGKPLYAAKFELPSRTEISSPLVVGSALFGVGWGLGGFCPGPGLVSLAGMGPEAGVFVLSMATGMMAHHVSSAPRRDKSKEVESQCYS